MQCAVDKTSSSFSAHGKIGNFIKTSSSFSAHGKIGNFIIIFTISTLLLFLLLLLLLLLLEQILILLCNRSSKFAVLCLSSWPLQQPFKSHYLSYQLFLLLILHTLKLHCITLYFCHSLFQQRFAYLLIVVVTLYIVNKFWQLPSPCH